MSNGKHPAFPCHSTATPAGMTYRQHLIARLAPVTVDAFFNHDAFDSYEEMADSLMNAVDAIVAAEQETSE